MPVRCTLPNVHHFTDEEHLKVKIEMFMNKVSFYYIIILYTGACL